MFGSLDFKRKISLLIAVSMAGLLILAAVSIIQTRSEILEGKRSQLVSAVQSQYSIVLGFQAAAANGRMSVDAAKAAASLAVSQARYGGANGKTDYFYILTADGVGVMHPFLKTWNQHEQLLGVKNAQGVDTVKGMVEAANATRDATVFAKSLVARPGDLDPKAKLYPKLQYMMKVPQWDWIVGSGLYTDDVDAQVNDALLRVLGIVAVVLASIGGIGYLIARSVVRQLGGDPEDAIRAMNEVARGNLAIDLRQPPAGSLLAALSIMLASLRTMVSQVRESADSIQVASSEVATGNQDLSARTEQTASNLQQTASSMVHLTGTVNQSAEAARTANGLATSAAVAAQKGGSVVTQVVATMNEINASSKRIADIIGVIDGIAFQTNILALNAAVEAARAGEQGRGFAVVASEVRNLAQRSAEAAKEIKALIGKSVDKVEIGSRLVGDAGSTMDEIVSSVKRVSDVIGEITAAADEQSSGIGQVNTSVAQLDQMTQQNAALVEQSAAAAESLKDQAHALAGVVSIFQL